jgi:hypothetical protein
MALTADAIVARCDHPVAVAPEVAVGVSEEAQRLGSVNHRLPSREAGPD